jgi:alkylhydroperoxidase/carboxymuconolactone decarboxylase family protein YurZ
MSDNLNDAPVLDLLARMTADSLAASSLDTETLILVRIAALVAMDAAPVSYALNLEAASAGGLDIDSIRGVLTAIAPIVGTARIAAATGNIVQALAAEVELADLEVAELWEEDDQDYEDDDEDQQQ